MSKRINTKYSGVFYRESKTNAKADKTFYIRYKDLDNKLVELKIGKYSEGIRGNYCYEQRINILNKIKLGEQPPIRRKKEINIITFDEFANNYFKDKEIHNKDNERSKGRYKKVLYPLIGTKNVENINREDIEEIQRILIKEKSPKTVNWFIAQIRAIFNHAILKQKYTKNNPASKIIHHKTDNARERYLKTEEIKQLIDTVKDDQELTIFTLLSLSTGGRLQTIMNIRKKDIDFENNIITLKDIKNDETYRGFFDANLNERLKTIHKQKNNNDLIIG
ncbi:MAG: tyrosine-type recombinase/integrase [Campylobacterota bacterium]|nr:tyrosine-type recombinase/integrase [Campylobacterota bacterium]